MSDRPMGADGAGTQDGAGEDGAAAADPYRYLTADGGSGGSPEPASSYLPTEVVAERAVTPGDGAPAAPPAGESDEPLEITVGMTRRELRELRARRAARAAQDEAGAAAAPAPTASIPTAPSPNAPSPNAPAPTAPAATDTAATAPPTPAAPSGAAAGAPARAWGVAPPVATEVERPAVDSAPGSSDLPGWHDPAPRPRRRLPLLIVLAVLVVAAIVATYLVLQRGGAEEPDPSPSTSASPAPTGLAAVLPQTVTGGEFADTGVTGVTYTLTEQGFLDAPTPPAGASESLVGTYEGGAAEVTLTGASFATTQEALDAATSISSSQSTTAVDTGPVFPAEQLGTYWTFNNDGLVTIVWHDGATGMYTVVSEASDDALGFYGGLDF